MKQADMNRAAEEAHNSPLGVPMNDGRGNG